MANQAGNTDPKNAMNDWMRGRNGADELSLFVVLVALILIIIDIFARQTWLILLALVLVAYTWFRMSSRKIAQRQDENARFVKLIGPVAPWLRDPRGAAKEHKSYKHAACPNCGQKIRVPRGKGHLRVTCPKCHEKFDVQS